MPGLQQTRTMRKQETQIKQRKINSNERLTQMAVSESNKTLQESGESRQARWAEVARPFDSQQILAEKDYEIQLRSQQFNPQN